MATSPDSAPVIPATQPSPSSSEPELLIIDFDWVIAINHTGSTAGMTWARDKAHYEKEEAVKENVRYLEDFKKFVNDWIAKGNYIAIASKTWSGRQYPEYFKDNPQNSMEQYDQYLAANPDKGITGEQLISIYMAAIFGKDPQQNPFLNPDKQKRAIIVGKQTYGEFNANAPNPKDQVINKKEHIDYIIKELRNRSVEIDPKKVTVMDDTKQNVEDAERLSGCQIVHANTPVQDPNDPTKNVAGENLWHTAKEMMNYQKKWASEKNNIDIIIQDAKSNEYAARALLQSPALMNNFASSKKEKATENLREIIRNHLKSEYFSQYLAVVLPNYQGDISFAKLIEEDRFCETIKSSQPEKWLALQNQIDIAKNEYNKSDTPKERKDIIAAEVASFYNQQIKDRKSNLYLGEAIPAHVEFREWALKALGKDPSHAFNLAYLIHNGAGYHKDFAESAKIFLDVLNTKDRDAQDATVKYVLTHKDLLNQNNELKVAVLTYAFNKETSEQKKAEYAADLAFFYHEQLREGDDYKKQDIPAHAQFSQWAKAAINVYPKYAYILAHLKNIGSGYPQDLVDSAQIFLQVLKTNIQPDKDNTMIYVLDNDKLLNQMITLITEDKKIQLSDKEKAEILLYIYNNLNNTDTIMSMTKMLNERGQAFLNINKELQYAVGAKSNYSCKIVINGTVTDISGNTLDDLIKNINSRGVTDKTFFFFVERVNDKTSNRCSFTVQENGILTGSGANFRFNNSVADKLRTHPAQMKPKVIDPNYDTLDYQGKSTFRRALFEAHKVEAQYILRQQSPQSLQQIVQDLNNDDKNDTLSTSHAEKIEIQDLKTYIQKHVTLLEFLNTEKAALENALQINNPGNKNKATAQREALRNKLGRLEDDIKKGTFSNFDAIRFSLKTEVTAAIDEAMKDEKLLAKLSKDHTKLKTLRKAYQNLTPPR